MDVAIQISAHPAAGAGVCADLWRIDKGQPRYANAVKACRSLRAMRALYTIPGYRQQ